MTSRLHLGTLQALAVSAWFALLWWHETPVGWDHLGPFGLVLGFLVAVVGLFKRWWWSWSWLRGWFVQRPDLRGTWRVTLKSEWRDRRRKKTVEAIEGYMVVRQTLTTLNMRLLTRESSSRLVAHNVVRADDGVYSVAAVFVNEPKLELRGKRSEIHYGAMMLQVQGQPPTTLEGHYWTDRDSRGTMLVDRRVDKLFDRFDEAEKRMKKIE